MDVLDVRLVLCCVENRVIFSEPYHIFGHFALDELALVYANEATPRGPEVSCLSS